MPTHVPIRDTLLDFWHFLLLTPGAFYSSCIAVHSGLIVDIDPEGIEMGRADLDLIVGFIYNNTPFNDEHAIEFPRIGGSQTWIKTIVGLKVPT